MCDPAQGVTPCVYDVCIHVRGIDFGSLNGDAFSDTCSISSDDVPDQVNLVALLLSSTSAGYFQPPQCSLTVEPVALVEPATRSFTCDDKKIQCLIWLDEMADLMMLNAPIKGVLINRRMPMTLLSEGWMTLHCGWTTVRGSFGTIVCDPTGQKDLCYREGAISYMPQSMMCCQHENVSQPAPGESPAEGGYKSAMTHINAKIKTNQDEPTNSAHGSRTRDHRGRPTRSFYSWERAGTIRKGHRVPESGQLPKSIGFRAFWRN